MNKKPIRLKQEARKLVVQALYQWQVAQHAVPEIEAQFCAIHSAEKVDLAYFSALLQGIVAHEEVLKALLVPYLDRPLRDLNPVELCVLLIGSYALRYEPTLPCRIILDEAVNLTKLFGSQDGHRYVNGVLHQIATQLRPGELSAS